MPSFKLPLVSLFCWALTAQIFAEDLRVYTSVYDISQSENEPKRISDSLTLFHAGKVYDYMEGVGEVVIFEPAHHRFIILRDFTATEVSFSELNHFLESAKVKAEEYIGELSVINDPNATKTAAAVRFQLAPQFQTKFDAGLLTMQGGYMNYLVKSASAESDNALNQYLEYADWASRLNYVLHNRSAFPASRLKLNEELRKHRALPTRVELTMQQDRTYHLRADHKFEWKIQTLDKQLITHWERVLHSDQVAWVTFHQYQQKLIAQQER